MRYWWVAWIHCGRFDYKGPWWRKRQEIGAERIEVIYAAVAAVGKDHVMEIIRDAHDEPPGDETAIRWCFISPRSTSTWEPWSDQYPQRPGMLWPHPLTLPKVGNHIDHGHEFDLNKCAYCKGAITKKALPGGALGGCILECRKCYRQWLVDDNQLKNKDNVK